MRETMCSPCTGTLAWLRGQTSGCSRTCDDWGTAARGLITRAPRRSRSAAHTALAIHAAACAEERARCATALSFARRSRSEAALVPKPALVWLVHGTQPSGCMRRPALAKLPSRSRMDRGAAHRDHRRLGQRRGGGALRRGRRPRMLVPRAEWHRRLSAPWPLDTRPVACGARRRSRHQPDEADEHARPAAVALALVGD